MTTPHTVLLLHPLIARLVKECGYPLLDEPALAAFTAQRGDLVLFCAGDPVQHPECLDVAVVLPELDKAMPGKIRYAVCAPSLEAAAQARYGFRRWPTLVFLRNDEYIGAISGMQDWAIYLSRIEEMLGKPGSQPPASGTATNSSHSATPLTQGLS